MHVIEPRPSRTGTAEMFTGQVTIDEITDRSVPAHLRVNAVHFAAGARTAWHAHSLGQTLHVTEGEGRAQARDGEVLAMRPGDTVYTPPDEWHWHGAAPDVAMTHLAIWEAPDDGPESAWGDHVTDEEYGSST